MVEGEDRSNDGVLSPDDLHVADSDDVRQLDDNRFFVSLDAEDAAEFEHPADDGDGFADALDSVPETYGVALAAKTESGVEEYVTASNSVVETFERALVWYATQVGDAETPPDDVLRILLDESNLDV